MLTVTKDGLYSGFRIIDIVELGEFDALGIYARHILSGAEVFHIYNNDFENLFAFTFATSSGDSSGVAHILEHSVLCGSRNYPVKDPFIILAQGSLQTYLNAWTFPDKTVYPASSVNEADYFNLMSVYGDAVFFPNLDEWIFRQEGHRLQFDKTGKLSVTGVVYNEMKGAYSDFDDYAQHWSLKSIMPDTVYAFDSGGNPDCISELTYKQFLNFHREKYVPANCKIFLAGNINTEKQLDFLNEKFLSKLPASKAATEITLAQRWKTPKTYFVEAPAGICSKASVFISWLCGKDVREDPAGIIELSALTEVLLGHDGSPLLRALIESHLGEDLASVCGLEAELREPVWTAGLRGVGAEIKPQVIEEFILNELQKLTKAGIPKEEIDSALLSLEFSNKEIKRAGGPWSLVLMRRSLRGWIHNCKPWETLLFESYFAQLKEKIAHDKNYFENLIEKSLLNNFHRALITVQPDDCFLAVQEKKRSEKLFQLEHTMSKKEIRIIDKKNKELLKIQNNPDSPKALHNIPHIRITDLSDSIDTVSRSVFEAAGVPVVSNKIWTNGISYCDFAFPLDVLDPEDYIYLPLFSHCVTSLGVPGMDYAEVSSLFAKTVGDFYAMPLIGSSVSPAYQFVETPAGLFDIIGRDWMLFRLKCLDEKFLPSVELALRVIKEANFFDIKRLRDLILELKNDIAASLAPHGNTYAITRSSMHINAAKAKSEIISGITQFNFIHKVAQLPVEEIASALSRIRDLFFSNTGMIVHITGETECENRTVIEKYAASFGSPGIRNSAAYDLRSFLKITGEKRETEIWTSPSLQIGFAAMSFKASSYTDKISVFEQALAHHLSTGPLWETIRMKYGAYGARAASDSIENSFTFSTYRDPAPDFSLKMFREILHKATRSSLSTGMLEKIIIGAYSQIKQPRTNAQKGNTDFVRFLYGITDEMREKRLKILLGIKTKDLKEAALALEKLNNEPKSVIITGTTDVKTTAGKRNTAYYELGI
jgi:Zn-dependent M16 (insulinase) family peptidase